MKQGSHGPVLKPDAPSVGLFLCEAPGRPKAKLIVRMCEKKRFRRNPLGHKLANNFMTLMAKAESWRRKDALTPAPSPVDRKNRLRNDSGSAAVWSGQSELNQAVARVNPKKKQILSGARKAKPGPWEYDGCVAGSVCYSLTTVAMDEGSTGPDEKRLKTCLSWGLSKLVECNGSVFQN